MTIREKENKNGISNKIIKGLRKIKFFFLLKKQNHYPIYNNKSYNYRCNNIDIKNRGINSVGFFKENFGLSHGARYFTQTLVENKIPLVVNHFDIREARKDNKSFDKYLSENHKYNVNVFNFNSNYFLDYIKYYNKNILLNKYNILYPYWEFEEYPLEFLKSSKFLNEVWAPTKWLHEIYSRYYAVPVVYMPLAINFKLPDKKKYSRKFFGLPDKKFLFLFSCDIFSDLGGRKNPVAVIDAFNKAFKNNKDVHLVIKVMGRTTNTESYPKEIKNKLEAMEKYGNKGNFTLIDKFLEREEFFALTNCCDVYVSLHRSEGLGLGMIEAMKMGKPVIATNYSGNTDFMNYENSCPVDYKLVDANNPLGNNSYLIKHPQWAEPDIEHAAHYMKTLYEDKDFYNKISRNAKKYVDEKHNYDVIGEKIKFRLKLLNLI